MVTLPIELRFSAERQILIKQSSKYNIELQILGARCYEEKLQNADTAGTGEQLVSKGI